MSTSVYVWPNLKNPFKIFNHPGHSSMECKGNVNLYISWWPQICWVDDTNQTTQDNEISANEQANVGSYTPASLFHDAHNEMGRSARDRFKLNPLLQPRIGQEKLQEVFVIKPDRTAVIPPIRDAVFRKHSNLPGAPNTLLQDVWVQMPTRTIEIPDYDSGYDDDWPGNVPKGIGLNPYLIRYWWNGFSYTDGTEGAAGMPKRNNDYNMLSRRLNCASVVGRALDFGGAIWFFETSFSGNRYTFYNTPLNVADYATRLTQRINEYRQFIKTLNNLPLLKTKAREPWPLDNSLPSVEEWTKDSYVKAKFYKSAGRVEQVLEIDKKLAFYCATEEEFTKLEKIKDDKFLRATKARNYLITANKPRGGADGGLGMNYPVPEEPLPPKKPKKKYPLLKLDLCFSMLKLVKEHITKKPTSDRRDAVLRLGKRIVNVIAFLQEDLATGTCRLKETPTNFKKYQV